MSASFSLSLTLVDDELQHTQRASAGWEGGKVGKKGNRINLSNMIRSQRRVPDLVHGTLRKNVGFTRGAEEG